jgi:prepilin-type N-terminal cleavage/methylation domain-containing protein
MNAALSQFARRRAFTLLEMLLAVTAAGVVALVAVSAVAMMQRADERLSTRYQSATELSTVHTALTRAFGSMVTAPQSATAGANQAAANLTGQNTGTGGNTSGTNTGGNGTGGNGSTQTRDTTTFGGRSSSTTNGGGEGTGSPAAGSGDETSTEEGPRPRVIIGFDLTAQAMGEREFDPQAVRIGTPQVIEVVLSQPPAGYALPSWMTDADVQGLNLSGGGVRGVFELRPDPDQLAAWALWWRPVREDGSPWSETFELERERNAFRLAGNITLFRAQVFIGNERWTEYNATVTNDLPAYFEVEIRTGDGLYANWMFEVGWTTGEERHEMTEAELAALNGTGETDGESTGSVGIGGVTEGAGGGRGGGGRRPGGGRPPGDGEQGQRPPRNNTPGQGPGRGPGQGRPPGQGPGQPQGPGGGRP